MWSFVISWRRCGVEHVAAALSARGRLIVVVDPGESIDGVVGRGTRDRAVRGVMATKRGPGAAT